MILRTLLIAATALAVLATADASACMPMPPPPQNEGESQEAYAQRVADWQAERDAEDAAWRHQRQVQLWDEADSVVLARIVRVRPDHNDYFGETQRVTLRPYRTLKGRRYTNSFTLRYTDATSCGPLPGFDAIRGAVGDEFVIFLRGGRPSQRTVQGTASTGAITDTRITEEIRAD